MEIKLTEFEKQQLEKAYECIYHLSESMGDLEDYLGNVGWRFACSHTEVRARKGGPARTAEGFYFLSGCMVIFLIGVTQCSDLQKV